MRRSHSLILVALLAAGCGSSKTDTTVAGKMAVETPADPWLLTLTNSSVSTPALLWNGLIGLRLSRSSSGIGSDGKPLGFFMIDEYQPSGEEKLLQMPNPILVTWSVGNSVFDGNQTKNHDFVKSGGTPLDPSGKISEYKQQLDMRTGVLETSWYQDTPDAGRVRYECDSVVHPTSRAIAQRWTIEADKPATFSVKSLDYSGPNDLQEEIGADPNQTLVITGSKSRAVVLQTKFTGADTGGTATVGGFRVQEGKFKPGSKVVYDRVLCFGAHSAKPLPEFTAKQANQLKAIAPPPMTFDDVASASKAMWAKRWKTDIEIVGPVADQQAIHSFLFYLRSSIFPDANRSVSPFGLSDLQYNGHVFWDSDIWVFPALSLIDPPAARSIANYRLLKEPAAEAGFRAWFKKQNPSVTQPAVGTKFPWESSVTGQETAPGDSKLEDHITGSVLWGLTQAAALGLAPVPHVDQAAAKAANFYYVRGTRGMDGHFQYKHTMSPDENHVGDNDLYTNLLANWLVTGRQWGTPAQNLPFVLPHDKEGFLTYDGDQLRTYKQAAAVLSIYPLQFPEAEKNAKQMMARFESKVIPNGPAMTDSVHAVIWARAGEADKAYADWQKSWAPFTKNPFLLFSEKRTKDQTYFTTGAAGSLQAVLYGFLGFRLDLSSTPGSAWQKQLMERRILSIKPNLPSQWKSIKLKNFSVFDSRFTVTADHNAVQVTQGD